MESASSLPVRPTWLGIQATVMPLYLSLFVLSLSSVKRLGLDVDLFCFIDVAALSESVSITNLFKKWLSISNIHLTDSTVADNSAVYTYELSTRLRDLLTFLDGM